MVNGWLNIGKCKCRETYSQDDCSVRTIKNGQIVNKRIVCEEGWVIYKKIINIGRPNLFDKKM